MQYRAKPTKGLLGLARALKLRILHTSRARVVWRVEIPEIVEIMDLVLRQKQRKGDAVDRCVAPAFVIESSSFVEVLEV